MPPRANGTQKMMAGLSPCDVPANRDGSVRRVGEALFSSVLFLLSCCGVALVACKIFFIQKMIDSSKKGTLCVSFSMAVRRPSKQALPSCFREPFATEQSNEGEEMVCGARFQRERRHGTLKRRRRRRRKMSWSARDRNCGR